MKRYSLVWCALLLPVLSGCDCGGGGKATDVFVQARPRVILDNGEVSKISVVAVDDKGAPGRGNVVVTSSAGSLRAGATVMLDRDGLATVDFTCALADDPNCVGVINITASWTAGGATASGMTTVTLGVEPLRGACDPGWERTVDFVTNTQSDIQMAVPPAFSERSTLVSGNSDVGLMFFDPTNNIAGFAISRLPSGLGQQEETLGRGALGTVGTVSNPLTQTFTTWDGYSNSVRANYELESTEDLKTITNRLAAAMGGVAINSGQLQGTSVSGPFQVQATYVRRVARTVIVVTIAAATGFDDDQAGRMDELSGGTSLAQADDVPSAATAVPCEFSMVAAREPIDFLWVVDDSCSMSTSQDAVSRVGSVFAQRLQGAGLNWRVAGTSTGYYPSSFQGSIRQWTTSPADMVSWFTVNGVNSWGTGGNGIESGFLGLSSFLLQLKPPAGAQTPGPLRPEAQLHAIFLTDAAEQSGLTPQEIDDTVRQIIGPTRRFVAHGIICPPGEDCDDAPGNLPYPQFIERTGGVTADIRLFKLMTAADLRRQQDTISAIIRSAIAGAGQQLGGYPIAASVRVAINQTVGGCTGANVPHNAINGWDLDPNTGRVIAVGTCLPALGATMAISYRSYADTTPEIVDAGVMDAGSTIPTGDGGLLVIASQPVLYREIGQSVAVTTRLTGVMPNIGQMVDVSTTNGAFVTSADGGTMTSVTTTTGPAGISVLNLVDTAVDGPAVITARHTPSMLMGTTMIDIRRIQQLEHVITTCGRGAGNCSLLGVRGAGFSDLAQVTFRVRDSNNSPAVGVRVDFTVNMPPMGLSISPSAITNAQGEATAVVQAGSRSGVFRVHAVVVPGRVEADSPDIAITGAKPSNLQFSLACTSVNVSALKTASLSNARPLTVSCVTRIVDRQNNSVGTGVTVNLKTEAGTLINDVITQANTGMGSPNEGTGTFVWDSFGPWPPADVTPMAAVPAQFPYPRVAEPQRMDGLRQRNPRDGLITVMAYVLGEEHFDDNNANGLRDANERFIDQGEPFVDSNDNDVRDPQEFFVDEPPFNGVWDGPNGQHDSAKLIWTETRILATNSAQPGIGTIEGPVPAMCPGGVPKDGTVDLDVYLPDMNLNRVAPGSSLAFARTGSRGTIAYVGLTSLDDQFGFEYQRLLIDATTRQACVTNDPTPSNNSTRCVWSNAFGTWGRGYAGQLRIRGTAPTDMTPCANDALSAEVNVLGTQTVTAPLVFGIQ